MHWRNVEDEMPEAGKRVIVSTKGRVTFAEVERTEDGSLVFASCGWMLHGAVRWAPMPDVPLEDYFGTERRRKMVAPAPSGACTSGEGYDASNRLADEAQQIVDVAIRGPNLTADEWTLRLDELSKAIRAYRSERANAPLGACTNGGDVS